MKKPYLNTKRLVSLSFFLLILLGFQAKSQSITIGSDTICEGETGFIPISIVGGQSASAVAEFQGSFGGIYFPEPCVESFILKFIPRTNLCFAC